MALLTEEEARGQVCPLITFCANEENVVRQRDAAIHAHQNCQASACRIGWRWGPAGEKAGVGFCGAFGEPSRPTGMLSIMNAFGLDDVNDDPGTQ